MSHPPKGCPSTALAASTTAGNAKSSRPPGIKKSKTTRWRVIVLILVHVLFALHLAHWLDGGKTISPIEPSEAMEFSKRSAINAGFIFFALMTLSTLLLGRFFCGWACHLVALQDLCAAGMKRIGITPRPLRSRWLALVPFAAGFYLFIWPFFQRVQLGVTDIPVTLELETSQFWATFPGLIISILTLLAAGFGAVYFLGSKGFCTYACPYGAFFNVADRFAPLRIRVNDQCEGCGHCTVACTSNVAVAVEVRKYGMVVDPGCMKCMDCVSTCPKDALSLSFGKPAIAVRGKKSRKARFGFGYELLLALAFVAAFFAFRGLYGRVPFLMTLAVAGCLAFLFLRTVEMFTKSKVSIPPFGLKDQGKTTASGKVFLALMVGVLGFWAHSGWIRFNDWQSKQAYEPLIPVRDTWFTRERVEVTPELRATAEEVIRQADHVIQEGLWETPRVRVERGWAHMILGHEDEFMSDLAIASELAPRDVNSLVERGHLLRTKGRSQDAVPLYREAALRDPDQGITLTYFVQASGEAKLLPQAVEFLKEVTAKRSWDGVAFEVLARAHALHGFAMEDPELKKLSLEKEVAALHQAIELSEQGKGPWGRLVEVYFNTDRKDEAESLARSILEKDPELVPAHLVLVSILLQTGKQKEAKKALKAALKVKPEDQALLDMQQNMQPE